MLRIFRRFRRLSARDEDDMNRRFDKIAAKRAASNLSNAPSVTASAAPNTAPSAASDVPLPWPEKSDFPPKIPTTANEADEDSTRVA